MAWGEGIPALGGASEREEPMRIYARTEVCGFRYSAAEWGELSNFYPLAVPITAGPWLFATSEGLYQAAKFAAHPTSSGASPRRRLRGRRRPSAARRVSASPPAGTRSASTSCAGCCG